MAMSLDSWLNRPRDEMRAIGPTAGENLRSFFCIPANFFADYTNNAAQEMLDIGGEWRIRGVEFV